MENISVLQLIFGALTVVTALSVVLLNNPVVSAVMLMATLFLTGGLYFGLGYYFIGAVQILIYAGAISVLFVFIVMLLDLKPFFLQIPGRKATAVLAMIAGAVMLGALALTVIPGSAQSSGSSELAVAQGLFASQPKTIALQFLSKYMLPYQVTGLLILASVMGVVVLGRPRKTQLVEKI